MRRVFSIAVLLSVTFAAAVNSHPARLGSDMEVLASMAMGVAPAMDPPQHSPSWLPCSGCDEVIELPGTYQVITYEELDPDPREYPVAVTCADGSSGEEAWRETKYYRNVITTTYQDGYCPPGDGLPGIICSTILTQISMTENYKIVDERIEESDCEGGTTGGGCCVPNNTTSVIIPAGAPKIAVYTISVELFECPDGMPGRRTTIETRTTQRRVYEHTTTYTPGDGCTVSDCPPSTSRTETTPLVTIVVEVFEDCV